MAARKALKSVGFELLHEEDLAARELIEHDSLSRGTDSLLLGNDEVKWYYPLEGNVLKAQTTWDSMSPSQHTGVRCFPPLTRMAVFTVFRMSRLGRFLTQNALWGIEKVGLVPKGTYDVGESLIKAQAALVAGGQTQLFT